MIAIVLLGLSCVLVTILAGSLRHLNYSQLRRHFTHDEYETLLKQLSNDDAVELAAECLSVGLAMATVLMALNRWPVDEMSVLFGLCFGILFLVGILPRLFVAPWAEKLLIEMLPLYTLIEKTPGVVWSMNFVLGTSRRLAGETADDEHVLEMAHLIHEGEAEGRMDSTEKDLMEGVLALKDTVSREIMTPWAEAVFLTPGAQVREGMAVSAEHGLSRLPLYDNERDQVLGVFFVRDVLEKLAKDESVLDEPVEKLMRQVPLIPETRSVLSLLVTMCQSRNQMVLILDEYGTLDGLLTLEDILEEIVGDIRDEYAVDDREIVELGEGLAEVVAGINLEDLNEALKLTLPLDERYESLAGFLLTYLQRVPKKGELFAYNGCRFQITQATARRVEKVKLSWESAPDDH